MKKDHALKIEDFPEVDIKEFDEIEEVLRKVGDNLGLSSDRIHNLECRRRDGFIPYSSNKGGIEIAGYTDIRMFMGSGYSFGSEKVNELINEYYNNTYEEVLKDYKTDNNLPLDIELNDEHLNYFDEILDEKTSGEYSSIQVEYQGRYLGYEDGKHSISLNVFLSVADAPYFRRSDDDIERIITFKKLDNSTMREIVKAEDDLADFINNVELY